MDDLVSFEEDETFALSRIRAEHLSGISLKAYDELLTKYLKSDLPLANKYPWLGYLWETAESPAELARRHAVPLSRMTVPTFDTVWRRSANHTLSLIHI